MQLKHLFVFLSALAISVAESNANTQENSFNYVESSTVAHNKKERFTNTKLVFFNYRILSNTNFVAFFFPSINLKSAIQKQTIQLQKQLFQKISSLYIRHTFLLKKNTSSNSVPSLYFA